MAEEQDKGYRLLFSHPEMIEWLIRRFVPGPWLERLDFSRLEKVSERDVSPELLRREKDLLWRLPYVDEDGDETWFFVYLHFEFQSDVELRMAVREMTYKGLLYLDLERQGLLLPSGELPPVLSLVVYTGKRRWRAALSVSELIAKLPGVADSELPPGLAPDSYQVIDAVAYPFAELAREPNPVTTLFEGVKSGGFEDLRRVVLKTAKQLKGRRYRGLRRSFAVVFREVLIPAVAPGKEIPEVESLTEVASMLQQNVIEWRDAWVAEGRKEGEAKGQKREATHLFLELFTAKFGDLPARLRKRVAAASKEQLETWAKRLLRAERPEDVFED